MCIKVPYWAEKGLGTHSNSLLSDVFGELMSSCPAFKLVSRHSRQLWIICWQVKLCRVSCTTVWAEGVLPALSCGSDPLGSLSCQSEDGSYTPGYRALGNREGKTLFSPTWNVLRGDLWGKKGKKEIRDSLILELSISELQTNFLGHFQIMISADWKCRLSLGLSQCLKDSFAVSGEFFVQLVLVWGGHNYTDVSEDGKDGH